MSKVKKSDLLNAILANAVSLKDAGKALLKLGVGKDNKEEFARIACFLIFSSIEECGKYMMIRDIPGALVDTTILKDIGFRRHKDKMERLFRNTEIEYGTEPMKINAKEATRLMREAYRDGSLYVDAVGNDIVKPGSKISGERLGRLCELCGSTVKWCQIVNNSEP